MPTRGSRDTRGVLVLWGGMEHSERTSPKRLGTMKIVLSSSIFDPLCRHRCGAQCAHVTGGDWHGEYVKCLAEPLDRLAVVGRVRSICPWVLSAPQRWE